MAAEIEYCENPTASIYSVHFFTAEISSTYFAQSSQARHSRVPKSRLALKDTYRKKTEEDKSVVH